MITVPGTRLSVSNFSVSEKTSVLIRLLLVLCEKAQVITNVKNSVNNNRFNNTNLKVVFYTFVSSKIVNE